MTRKKHIDEAVDKAMKQIGGEKYRANPFLYTRVQQQIENRRSKGSKVSLYWKPALVMVLILFNAFIIWQNRVSSNDYELANTLTASYYWTDSEDIADVDYLFSE